MDSYQHHPDTFPSGMLTYGQEMVEFSFDPSTDRTVNHIRAMFAAIIDRLDSLRSETEDKEALTEAITGVYEAYLKAYGAVA